MLIWLKNQGNFKVRYRTTFQVRSARAGHTLTTLAGAQQIAVLYGGFGDAAMSDVHLLLPGAGENAAWVQPRVVGRPPPPRCAHSAVATPCGRGVVVFGGFTGAPTDGGADGSRPGPLRPGRTAPCGQGPGPAAISPGPNWENSAKIRQNLAEIWRKLLKF